MLSEHERYYGLGMDALAIVCSRNANVIMVWEWMHLLSHALGTRTLLWFGHGRTIFGMLSEHYVLGMVALFLVCFRNTNVIMVWAWLHYLSYALLLYALGTRTLLWFGHGCAIVCSRNTNVIMVWAWMHLLSYALRTRTLLWFGHGCFGIRVRSSLKNAMRGIRSISGPRNTSNAWFVPRRPHPERSARCAFFARLRSGGANNNNGNSCRL